MIRPLLSIVVPTRNRYNTLDTVVNLLTQIPDDNLEIIVQDCSSNNEEFETIKNKYIDHRFKCFKSLPNISMTQNWNNAFLNVSGIYVIFIGDDDLVSPEIMKVVRWAMDNEIEAVCGSVAAMPIYCWPDYPSQLRAKTLEIKRCNGSIEYIDGLAEAVKGSSGYGLDYFKLPKIYHGIVKRSLIEELHKISGKYFDGISPDYYAAFSLALIVKKFCIIDYPITIVGASAKSNTAKTDGGKFAKDHLSEYEAIDWPFFLPFIQFNDVFISESMVKAFVNLKREDLVKNIDICKLYTEYVLRENKHIYEILKDCFKSAKYLNRSLLYTILKISMMVMNVVISRKITRYIYFFKKAFNLIVTSCPKKTSPNNLIRDVPDMKEALNICLRHFSWVDKILINKENCKHSSQDKK